MNPYGLHLLVCGQGTCAPAQAAQDVHRQLGELNRRYGLNTLSNPHRVKCTMCDCLGVCSGGPVLAVYPDGIWYRGLDSQAVERIYQEHVLLGRPVEEFIFHRLFPQDGAPGYAPEMRGQGGRGQPALGSSSTAAESQGDRAGAEASAHGGDPAQAESYRRAVRRTHRSKGLIIVNTGCGKGKTTAAIGILTRAWGRRMRVGVLQFLKNENARFGEILAGRRMGVDWISTGDGWTWTSRDQDETQARAVRGWTVAQERIRSGAYDLLVLDEFTYPLHYGWLETARVVEWLRANKPPMLHLVITGRYAPSQLIEAADLATEMREIKHPFRQQGIRAQKGIEF